MTEAKWLTGEETNITFAEPFGNIISGLMDAEPFITRKLPFPETISVANPSSKKLPSPKFANLATWIVLSGKQLRCGILYIIEEPKGNSYGRSDGPATTYCRITVLIYSPGTYRKPGAPSSSLSEYGESRSEHKSKRINHGGTYLCHGMSHTCLIGAMAPPKFYQ
ncbi:hypothetical protein TcasGA2_TC014429 [Tribolium castaneum]|uniref:Uncharacterized protein n=1 Tax=Tribolium castaneum TaxID=7070 RepID=D6WLX2_TRICA|nr:hypothetical protein TcasGA2_TC014429 [Tribolium castaneum]